MEIGFEGIFTVRQDNNVVVGVYGVDTYVMDLEVPEGYTVRVSSDLAEKNVVLVGDTQIQLVKDLGILVTTDEGFKEVRVVEATPQHGEALYQAWKDSPEAKDFEREISDNIDHFLEAIPEGGEIASLVRKLDSLGVSWEKIGLEILYAFSVANPETYNKVLGTLSEDRKEEVERLVEMAKPVEYEPDWESLEAELRIIELLMRLKD